MDGSVTSDPTAPAPSGEEIAFRTGPGRVLRTASATAVLSVVVVAQLGLVLAPSQLDRNPLLVLALRPTPAMLVLVGDLVAPWAAVGMAAAGRTLVDVAYFAVARHGAAPILQRFGVGRALSRSVSGHRTTGGLLTLTFFWSSTPVIAALGVSRTPLLPFLAATGLGNVTTSGAFVLLGRHVRSRVAPVTAWVTAHGTAVTIAVVAVMVMGTLLAVRRDRPPAAPLPALSE